MSLSAVLVRRVVENFQVLNTTPEQMTEAVALVAQLSREISGLSDVDYVIRNLRPSLLALTQQLISLGVAASDAAELTLGVGVKRFQDAYNQLFDVQQTPAEQLAAKRASGELLKAELELHKAELMVRANVLAEKIKMAATEANWPYRTSLFCDKFLPK